MSADPRLGDSQTERRLRRPAILVDDRREPSPPPRFGGHRAFVDAVAPFVPRVLVCNSAANAVCLELQLTEKLNSSLAAVAVLDGNPILAGRRSGNLKDEQLAHSALRVRRYGAGNTKG